MSLRLELDDSNGIVLIQRLVKALLDMSDMQMYKLTMYILLLLYWLEYLEYRIY